ncbi:MAG: hypothetical protein L0Z50_40130 [Verrucomicrobiales bacterium]|nr:hypothetical protein [Verrucomicrobiales bacterium]
MPDAQDEAVRDLLRGRYQVSTQRHRAATIENVSAPAQPPLHRDHCMERGAPALPGLVPSEDSTGGDRKHGGGTKMGNGRECQALIEVA